MAVRNNFAAGEVLAAADLNDTFASKVDYATPTNAQSGTGASAYTFVLADAQRLTTATGTSAKTFTIPPQTSVAWANNSIIRVANYGAGDLTIAGGSGVTVTNATKTLAPYESAALVRTGSNAWTLLPFSGGAANADFSNAASGTYTDNGITYKWIQFTASGTLTITKAGVADFFVVGGGGGGGAGGVFTNTQRFVTAQNYDITIGAGGAGSTSRLARGSAGNETLIVSANNDFVLGAFGGGGGGDPDLTGAGGSGACGGGGAGGGVDGSPAGVGGTALGKGCGSGNNGGNSTAASGGQRAHGGGGGYSSAGSNATSNTGGNGGNAVSSSFSGSAVSYAGGGGGGALTTGGTGGTNAGNGSSGNTNGGNATANRGGGGGGGGQSSGSGGISVGGNGGNGGSGIVIVRVRT